MKYEMICFRIFCLLLTICGSNLFTGSAASTFSGCFTVKTGGNPIDIESAGWSEYSLSELSISKCVETCVIRYKKFAAVTKVDNEMAACHCGTEQAYTRLGPADHINPLIPCHNREWSMEVYLATGDVSSQYVGCYKEVNDTSNMASSSKHWIDNWIMTPEECVRYCKQNREFFANVKHGDTCTCGISFAKHGRVDDSQCNKVCAGSLGEKCGGDLANSVYFTLSLQEMLRTTFNPTIILRSNPVARVNVPYTQAFINDIYNVETSLSAKLPVQKAQIILNQMTNSIELLQYVAGMTNTFTRFTFSDGFALSNSDSVKQLLSNVTYPKELHEFISVITQAHTFLDQDTNQLLEKVANATKTLVLLKPAIEKAKIALVSYYKSNVVTLGVERSLKAAQLMVSASRNCLPLLAAKKAVMVNNLESAARKMMKGPHGTTRYLQSLNQPFSNLSTVTVPIVNTIKWKENLAYISQSWSSFMHTNGKELIQLLRKTYTSCLDSACMTSTEESFAEAVNKVNLAKSDMSKFISENHVLFSAVDWNSYKAKLAEISDDFDSVTSYLHTTGISTADDVYKLTESMTSLQFYQSCVSKISTMVKNVCYKTSYPDELEVKPVTC